MLSGEIRFGQVVMLGHVKSCYFRIGQVIFG